MLALRAVLIFIMKRTDQSKVTVPSVSGTNLSRTVAPSSAESTPPEVVTIRSVINRKIDCSVPLPPITNPSDVVSGSAEGVGIVPPPTAAVRCSGDSQLSDRVQHSLKRSFESEEMPGLLKQFVSSKKHAPVVSSAFSAPAALGAPPPDNSFLFSLAVGPTRDVEGSASSALFSYPGLGLDRRLASPSLTAERDWKERSLRSLSRVPVESQASSFNSSGMLNRTGLVDRHILPYSLPLLSRSSVPVSRSFADPYSPPSEDFGGAVPAFESVPSYQEVFEVEDPEWVDPFSFVRSFVYSFQ